MEEDFDTRRQRDELWGTRVPFHRDVIRPELVEFDTEANTCTIKMTHRDSFCNTDVPEWAAIHGGILAALADTASGFVCEIASRGRISTTVNLNLDCLAPARETDLTAKARSVKCGRRIRVSEVAIYNDAGKLVAAERQTVLFDETR